MISPKSAWNFVMLSLMAIWVSIIAVWFFKFINADLLIIFFLGIMAAALYFFFRLIMFLYDFYELGAEYNKIAVVGSFLNLMMVVLTLYLLSWF